MIVVVLLVISFPAY
ncbi:type I toxin-antitoxin system Ibs family toxin [Escherichia coli]